MRHILWLFFWLLIAQGWQCQSHQSPDNQDRYLPELAIHHAMILHMDSALTFWAKGHLVIDAGKIVEMVPDTGQVPPPAQTILDGSGKLLMPGLVNTHTHSPMTLFRGLADDMALKTWLENHIWPAEATYMQPEAVRIGTRLAMAEMIRGGTTTFNDMYFFVAEMAEEVDQAGMRATLSEGILDFPTPSFPTATATMQETRRLAEVWKDHPRVRIGVGPHSCYTLSRERLQAAYALADSLETLLHIHLAETRGERQTITQQAGLGPTQWLHQLGFWQHQPTVAAHGVWLEPEERALLIEHQIGLAHNPESNMKLASGVAPVPAWIAEGGKVGLGTDGASSNNNLDMWEEIHTVAKLHKAVSLDPQAIDARQAVRMATIGGATVLGWADRIGSLEVGKQADMILLRLDGPHARPLYDIYAFLAYSAQSADVETVIIDGKIVMQDQVLLTIEEQALYTAVEKLAREIEAGDKAFSKTPD